MELRVLLVTPNREDANSISRMLEPVGIRSEHVSSCQEARGRLSRNAYSAVLTDASLGDGGWEEILESAFHARTSPPVVVTDRVADDRFWAEALNLGCYDVLAQPFDASEVQRILTLACSQVPARPAAAPAASIKAFSAAF